MERECSECGRWCWNSSFSRNQWSKGDGYSRCKDCVAGTYYQCHVCYNVFSNQNTLNMHMQVHRPRQVACPVCGEVRFKSGANAVQHVESGYCEGCPGKDNARRQIYGYARKQEVLRPFLNEIPMLTYGDYSHDVPDLPYRCPSCVKSFRQLSQLLQHQDQKHGDHLMIRY